MSLEVSDTSFYLVVSHIISDISIILEKPIDDYFFLKYFSR